MGVYIDCCAFMRLLLDICIESQKNAPAWLRKRRSAYTNNEAIAARQAVKRGFRPSGSLCGGFMYSRSDMFDPKSDGPIDRAMFISHQWLANDHPDPEAKQWKAPSVPVLFLLGGGGLVQVFFVFVCTFTLASLPNATMPPINCCPPYKAVLGWILGCV